MTISVVIARDDVGAPSTREVFETGVKYTVEGGDLMIYSGKPQLLGTYGSGNWMSVYVDDSVTVISTKPDESSDSGFGDDTFSFDSEDSSSDDDSSSEDSSSGDGSSEDSSSGDEVISLDEDASESATA